MPVCHVHNKPMKRRGEPYLVSKDDPNKDFGENISKLTKKEINRMHYDVMVDRHWEHSTHCQMVSIGFE